MRISKLVITAALLLQLAANAAPSFGAFTLEPEPLDKDSLESLLKRHPGQTKFLNAERLMYFGGMPSDGAPRPMPTEGTAKTSGRAIQESDVFKVGSPGSKLLYLLNDYRGLQVVSYADGLETPRLVGRSRPTGNYPEEMYSDLEHDRLIVLENDWSGNRPAGQVVLYNVRQANDPKPVGTIALEGVIADSRMVGQVLYIATSQYGYDGSQPKGFIYSFRLGEYGMEQADRRELSLPVSGRENMNIVETTQDGRTSYYLLAALSESGWGWWDRKTAIEVINITDPTGRIRPEMIVSAKGFVRERSQLMIKDGTLIVASNYQSADANAVTRIAVEGFKLPHAGAERLSQEEADYRKLWLERQLKGLSETEKQRKYQKLIADPTLGMKGRFVTLEDGSLRKPIPDSAVTVGDTMGLHASLQDVRMDGDLLYVFWVPQNQIDPFDLFDISKPDQEIKYLRRLQFDGWIERSIPLTFQGHRYVLGLGWIVDNVNNESSRRRPQVRLFEILRDGENTRSVDVASFDLSAEQGWANFNGQDKTIEIRQNENGTGTVLFPLQWSSQGNGGKVVGFDLKAAVQGNASRVFREGAFLAGTSGWLRRVFTNREIDRINSLTNTELGTYNVSDLYGSSGIARAVNFLELARNIQAYAELPAANGDAIGIQLIGKNEMEQTELRVVRVETADAERTDILDSLTVKGHYQAHFVDTATGSLLLATRSCEYLGCSRILSQIRWDGRELAVSAARSLGSPTDGGQPYYYGYNDIQLLRLATGQLLATVGSRLFQISAGSGFSVQEMPMTGCTASSEARVSLTILGGKPHLFIKDPVVAAEHGEKTGYGSLALFRHHLSPVEFNGGTAACKNRVNIPGEPVALIHGSTLVTREDKVVAFRESARETSSVRRPFPPIPSQVVQVDSLEALELAGGTAVLRDDHELGSTSYGKILHVTGSRLAFLSNASVPESGLISLGVDERGQFNRKLLPLGENVIPGAQFTMLLEEASVDGTSIALVNNGTAIQVLKWNLNDKQPRIVKLIPLDEEFRKIGAFLSVRLTGSSGWMGSSSQEPHYSPAARRLVLPQGFHGAQTFYLAE